jgi:hypothetical protein
MVKRGAIPPLSLSSGRGMKGIGLSLLRKRGGALFFWVLEAGGRKRVLTSYRLLIITKKR